MKPKKEQVAKLEKNAKVDSKKVKITDEMSENYMRDKIEKKKGRPKRDPYLSKIVRQSKTLLETSREDTKRFLAKAPESMFPLLKSVLGEETFNELMENPSHKEFLSSDEVLNVMAEMTEESAKFTIELLEKRAKGEDFKNPLNQESVNTFYASFQDKYKAKLNEHLANYFSTADAKENTRVPIYDLTEEDLAQLPEKETEKFKGIDWTATPTTSRWRPEFISQLKPIEIPKKLEHLIVPTVENEGDISENSNQEHLDLFSLSITNKSDEKIHKVKIFNYDFKEQKQIKYENLEGMAYSEFLRKLDKVESQKYTIQIIRLVAVCDYKKFQNKQLEAELYYKNKNIFARELTIPIQPLLYYSPEQEHANIIDIKKPFRLYSNSEFELEYLMPDTTVNLHFFLTKTKTK
jgi:hypothetical protein